MDTTSHPIICVGSEKGYLGWVLGAMRVNVLFIQTVWLSPGFEICYQL